MAGFKTGLLALRWSYRVGGEPAGTLAVLFDGLDARSYRYLTTHGDADHWGLLMRLHPSSPLNYRTLLDGTDYDAIDWEAGARFAADLVNRDDTLLTQATLTAVFDDGHGEAFILSEPTRDQLYAILNLHEAGAAGTGDAADGRGPGPVAGVGSGLRAGAGTSAGTVADTVAEAGASAGRAGVGAGTGPDAGTGNGSGADAEAAAGADKARIGARGARPSSAGRDRDRGSAAVEPVATPDGPEYYGGGLRKRGLRRGR